MTVVSLLLAVLIGLAIGLLGGGGAILAVPIFVYMLGFGAREAVASSLVVVGIASLFGAAEHWREGHVRLRVALVFGLFAMAGSFGGARLAAFLSEAFQLTLLAVVMPVAAFFVFRENDSDEGEAKDGADEGFPAWAHLGLPALGMAVGMLTGLVGVGGGFLIVPALALLAKTPMKEAVGTSLLVIAMNSASGFLGYLGRVEIQWGLLALFTAVAVAGSFAGTYLARFIPQVALRKVFAIFLVGIATFILYENLGAFF